MHAELPSDIFASRLRTERRDRGLSQAELAQRVGDLLGSAIDPSAITRIEQSRRVVRLDEAVAMAKVLGVSLASLLGHDPVVEEQQQIAGLITDLRNLQEETVRLGHQMSRLIQQMETNRLHQPTPLNQV